MLLLANTLPVMQARHGTFGCRPLLLPMGWKQLPPFFNAKIEAVANLANTCLAASATVLEHCPKFWVSQPPVSLHPKTEKLVASRAPHHYNPEPLLYIHMYIDDLIGLAQGMLSCCMRVPGPSFISWMMCSALWPQAIPCIDMNLHSIPR